MSVCIYTVFPQKFFAITTNLEHWVRVITKRGWILNEGEHNHVEQCNLKGLAHTRESHVVSYVQKTASSFASNLSSPSSKVKNGALLSWSGAANTSAVSWEMQNAASEELQLRVYCTCANCENYSRTIIISLVGKNVANPIWGQNIFEEIRYTMWIWESFILYNYSSKCIVLLRSNSRERSFHFGLAARSTGCWIPARRSSVPQHRHKCWLHTFTTTTSKNAYTIHNYLLQDRHLCYASTHSIQTPWRF